MYSRALRTLENDFALEDSLLKPLRLMTSLQVFNALQFDLKQCCAFPEWHLSQHGGADMLKCQTLVQADFDPATQSRLEQGAAASTSGKTFGFKVPASIQSAVQGSTSP